MTDKLYYKDSFLSVFDAEVKEVTQHKGRPAIVLDKTAFFPEGGGQPGDTGIIADVQIVDTQIENDTIYHYYEGSAALCAGQAVSCAIDWEKRFLRMQAHTGEHIVSGIAHRLFGVNNVGFHMDDVLMTVDFDGYLSAEELEQIENEANACVYKDVRVYARFPDEETLQKLDYRSKANAFENIRIVTVEGYDDCACCAVHLSSTGQVGLIKILSGVSHRGGVRIALICGKTALKDYQIKHKSTLHIADVLAAKHYETDAAVEKLLQKEKELHYMLQQKNERFVAYICEHTPYTKNNAVFCLPEFSPAELKDAAVRLKDCCGGLCCVISGEDAAGYYFAVASNALKVTDYTKEITSALNGSGGGRYDVIQGRLIASEKQISDYFEKKQVQSI